MVELIVVIGVLLVLLGLSLPALAAARERARRTVNLTKVRSGIALTTQYCADFRGVFPLNQPQSVIYSSDEWYLAVARWAGGGEGSKGYQFEIGKQTAVAMSWSVLADASHFDPADPATVTGSPARPVMESAVQSPSSKGILWQAYVARNSTTEGGGGLDHWCCGYERYAAPVGFGDGSVEEHAWQLMRTVVPPSAFENIGYPVVSTWHGPRGRDR